MSVVPNLPVARDLLLAEGSWKPGFGVIHGGERGLILSCVLAVGFVSHRFVNHRSPKPYPPIRKG